MTLVVHIVAISCAVVALGLSFFLTLEVAAGVFFFEAKKVRRRKPGSIAVVIPAHNESDVIAATLKSVTPQLGETDRVIVIADNCTDATAEIARTHNAEVLERADPVRRGKGYALQFAIDALRSSPPDIVIFVDADCLLSADLIERVSSIAYAENRPVQALYLMRAPDGAPPRLRAAEFAWLLINWARMRGLQTLFDVTRFTGAGLAAPWPAVATLRLGSGEIVEDLALTFELTKNGFPPLLIDDVTIESEFPLADDALTKQSARWSIGSLTYAARSSASWIAKGVAAGNPQLIGAALDLMAPPLTVFLFVNAGIIALAVLSWALGSAIALVLALLSFFLLTLSVAIGWWRFGREALPLSEFSGVFHFLLSKFSVFGAKGRASTKMWTPTRSDNQDDA